jgi:hypothetical protein
VTLRRAVIATVVAAAAVPVLPTGTGTASAGEIVSCSPTFLIGPYRCAVAREEERIRDENPPVDALLDQIDPT